MRYTHNENIIEAFRMGVDPIPDWFMDKVTNKTAILHKDHDGNIFADILVNHKWEVAWTDYYVVRRGERGMNIYSPHDFEQAYYPIHEDEPVNAAEPVDPEKERLNALNEYYRQITGEVKLIYDAFVDAGFKADEAFTLTMKLMENPATPPKTRSRSDILRDWKEATKKRKELLGK